jgi:hypothetical protein
LERYGRREGIAAVYTMKMPLFIYNKRQCEAGLSHAWKRLIDRIDHFVKSVNRSTMR